MIVIVDYGVGNLLSVKNMIRKAGYEAVLAADAATVDAADRIILPGVGAFDHCMQRFNASGLRPAVERRTLADKRPLLGICVGLQMLMDRSEEGTEPGLGWIRGDTLRFDVARMNGNKVPHMGWTEVRRTKPAPLTEALGDDPRFYFVHSYHVQPADTGDELLRAFYGYDFTAGVSRENISGVQFHPEKSHRFGMRVLENFCAAS